VERPSIEFNRVFKKDERAWDFHLCQFRYRSKKRLKNIILLDMNEAMAVSSKLSVTLVLIKILVISD